MPQTTIKPMSAGVAVKAEAIMDVVDEGGSLVRDIARQTGLPSTTVLRVASLLCDRGELVASTGAGGVTVRPARR